MIESKPNEQTSNGSWLAHYQPGDAGTIISRNQDASPGTQYDIGEHSYPIGTDVKLRRWDKSDNSWYCEPLDKSLPAQWVFQGALTVFAPPTPEEEAKAIDSIQTSYNTPSGEHPDLIRMREKEARAIEQGYTKGDVNHFVQPIIGHIRLALSRDQPIDAQYLEHAVEQLTKACNAELAWLHKEGEL